MARMIPSFMDEQTPPGERDLFNMLAAGPGDWVALHQLNLSPWNHGLRTEIDFVIIVPDAGILCVEVKSHENITFDEHGWRPITITRSPFKQALDGRGTLYRRLRELAPEVRVPVVHCCIFPRSYFDLLPNLSVQPWELMDNRVFRSFASGDALCSDLRRRMRDSITADADIRPLNGRLSNDQMDSIIAYCVPLQKRRPDRREEISRREEEIEKILREQQKAVLRLAEWNARLIVSGGAGTGKTLIAMEIARRAGETGRRTALLCFNQFVGDWMRRRMGQFRPALPNLVAGRAIQVMAAMAGIDIPAAPSGDFWETELPDRLEDRLTDPDFRAAALFDYVVLDEAQDLLARPRLWRCVTQFLAGGVERGAFSLFGDFANQVLADREAMNQSLSVLDASAGVTRWKLSENCRNYPIVGETAVKLSGFQNVYDGYLRTGGGARNYDISFYADGQAQLRQLALWLKEFKSQGYRPSEITILSFCSAERSAAVRLAQEGHRLRPVWLVDEESTGYASIHAFKGMENKVIILTDAILGEAQFHRDLFYTGMTRSTEFVRVLCNVNSSETLLGWLNRKD